MTHPRTHACTHTHTHTHRELYSFFLFFLQLSHGNRETGETEIQQYDILMLTFDLSIYMYMTMPLCNYIQSTPVISNSKGLTETLRDIRTSTYQS